MAPVKCSECNRPMRSTRALLAEFPGTVRAFGKGRCQGCAQRGTASAGGRAGSKATLDVGALNYKPIPEPTPDERRLILRQVNRLGGDDAAMLAAMMLGPVMS